MEESTSVIRMGRLSSIEAEPRTLKVDQIRCARVNMLHYSNMFYNKQEAAICVMNTKTIEEAMSIFTDGLKPVVSIARQSGISISDSGEEFEVSSKLLRIPGLRDIASAPF
ncbi:hypothetical protein RJ641_011123 [Dillenia turbinata]|uniref:Uncharacterized protein n=1 Tax=Dillenia turbinata TaxID=194707 RepID=A0AAN8V0V2_9MAGN